MSDQGTNESISRRGLLTASTGAMAATPLLSTPTTADSHEIRTDTPANINWNITHPDDTDNRFYSICETTDPDEYIIVGWSAEPGGLGGEADTNVLLYRVTQSGSVVWKKELNFDAPVKVNDVIHAGDDKFFAAGGLLRPDAETLNEGIAIKFDGLGGVEWTHTHPADHGGFTTLTQQNDDILLAGGQNSQENFSSDVVSWVVKMTTSGEFLWEETYEEGAPCRSISYSPNGIALATLNADETQGSLIVTDTDGSIEFGRKFDEVYPKSVLWDSDDTIHLCGDTDLGPSGGENVSFLGYNQTGSEKYNRISDPGAEGTLATDALSEINNGFVTAGWFADPEAIGSNQKGWIVEYDEDGISTGYVAGGSGDDWINNFVMNGDDQYLTVGSTTSFGDTDDKNAWVSSISTNEGSHESPIESSRSSQSGNTNDSGFGFIFSNILRISAATAVFIFFLLILGAFVSSNDPDDDNNDSIPLNNRSKVKYKKEKYETDEHGQIKEK